MFVWLWRSPSYDGGVEGMSAEVQCREPDLNVCRLLRHNVAARVPVDLHGVPETLLSLTWGTGGRGFSTPPSYALPARE